MTTATSIVQPTAIVAAEIENAGSFTNNSNTSSSSSISASSIPYYGSREPKQSIRETDRVIFQMMDDIQISKTAFRDNENDIELYKQDPLSIAENPTKRHGVLWRFRIVLSSIIILLLVVVTVVVSEITKERS